ncbi:hypothetical protein CQY20_07015 [Mycolicibacterium agri]|uniref:Uncharacterized protein n=1 Tax=Mycolicibacterium agri TaxID=36811 RepID=A0A2A7N9V5_MYCAG|nr:hypothetical protein [Mycolicibacterium agri]PEG40674.1 hypothetical protein CQY20_07015 [Mycolicibacterium agri]GFG49353.1 hypothetical protein MAGR_07940 [Mycolicibacterium agri]
MFTETQWDHEVDVLCVGAEDGVLATALVAANADRDAYLAVTQPVAGNDVGSRLGYRGGDGQTTRHLAGFDYAFGFGGPAQALWPVRAAETIAPPAKTTRGAIEPFFGAALEQWAHRCAAAPSGLIYDRVGSRHMAPMRSTARAEKVEAAVVGTIELSPSLPALSLTGWLRSRGEEADLRPRTGVRLCKLIFEEDAPVGALLETDSGLRAVRARENLVIAFGGATADCAHPLVSATAPVTVRVCLVSKAASRFGELELITAAGDDNRLLFVDAPGVELAAASA